MAENLTLEVVKQAIIGNAAAFRCVTEYQPAGGPGDKVFPPTYAGGLYAVETRVFNGQRIECVLLDSVPSQANRMELALLEAYRARKIDLPLISVRFDQEIIQKKFTITSLEAPHRIADAIFRDCLLDGTIFRSSRIGRILDNVGAGNATGLLGVCPQALFLGLWDSAGPLGGSGGKIQRALVSEIIGLEAEAGVKTESRIDPLQIMLDAGPLYERAIRTQQLPHWTLDENLAALDKGERPKKLGKSKEDKAPEGRPSEANHSNVAPTIKKGGFTVSKAIQTTVLSLAALRRLRFPIDSKSDSEFEVDLAARTALATLALAAAVLVREQGADLRSRCLLFPVEEFVWHLLDTPGKVKPYILNSEQALDLFKAALAEAKAKKLPWEDEIVLTPSEELVRLVANSQAIAMRQAAEGA